jgi:predicted site-specific integrase-resolvase
MVNERIYTPKEIAEQYRISVHTAQNLFRNESGTIRLANQKPGRRQRTLMRVPESVVLRVMQGKQIR